MGISDDTSDHTHVSRTHARFDTWSLRSPTALRALARDTLFGENRNGHFGDGIESNYEPKWSFRVIFRRKFNVGKMAEKRVLG